MRCLLAVGFTYLLLSLAQCKDPPAYTIYYFDQLLDHYSNAIYGEGTFRQKVLVNDDFVKPNAKDTPIFFYSGNEGPIEGFFVASGFILELAATHQALVVFAEHRFYGDSLPFGDASFDYPHIGLLTVDQALADYVQLIENIKFRYGPGLYNSPVITFGGSYGGMLSAYLRFKFPNVFDGALAASAPVRLADSKVARHSFWTVATKDYREVSVECEQKVREGFAQMHNLSTQGQAGYDVISEQFDLCSPIEDNEDYEQLLYTIRNAFVSMTMGDYPYPTQFLADLPAWPVNYSCGLIEAAPTAINGLFQATALVYNGTNGGPLTCIDPYELYIRCADPTGCGLGNDAKAWDYQVCYEISLSYGSNGVTDMFAYLPWNQQDIDSYCLQTWNTTGRHAWSAVNFWGSDVWAASNIIFSNGLLDPWHVSGILKSEVKSLPTVIIAKGAHHLDLRASNPADPPSVVQARIDEARYIDELLKKVDKKKRYQ